MPTKIYRLNQRKNTASFTLVGKLGNHVRYNFERGNAMTGIPARCVLADEYCQKLLEESELFNNIVVLERVIKDDKPKEEEKELIHIDDVTSVSQAVSYVADNWGKRVTTARQAINVAKENGYDFPNLKIGK